MQQWEEGDASNLSIALGLRRDDTCCCNNVSHLKGFSTSESPHLMLSGLIEINIVISILNEETEFQRLSKERQKARKTS